MLVKLDTSRITDWDTFHDVFAETFGFPDFYARNRNAWIDCMTYLDDAEAGVTSVHASPGGVIVLQLEDVADFSLRCQKQYKAIIECAAFVNWRRIETSQSAVLVLSFHKTPPVPGNLAR